MLQKRGEVPRKAKDLSFPTMRLVGEKCGVGHEAGVGSVGGGILFGTRVSQQLLRVLANFRVCSAPHILGIPALPIVHHSYVTLA